SPSGLRLGLGLPEGLGSGLGPSRTDWQDALDSGSRRSPTPLQPESRADWPLTCRLREGESAAEANRRLKPLLAPAMGAGPSPGVRAAPAHRPQGRDSSSKERTWRRRPLPCA